MPPKGEIESICVHCCVQPDVVDESSQVSLSVTADGSQTEVETLKHKLHDNEQVCAVIVSAATSVTQCNNNTMTLITTKYYYYSCTVTSKVLGLTIG